MRVMRGPNAECLDDGVYVDFDGQAIEIFTSDGIAETNHVFLDHVTLTSFEYWLAQLRQKYPGAVAPSQWGK